MNHTLFILYKINLYRKDDYLPYIKSVDGTNIYYEDYGEGDSVIFVHGWGASHESWQPQVLEFAKKYRVITIDLRGHGDSDKPYSGYSYEDHCNDINSLIDQLKLVKPTLLGWSYGGSIATYYSAHYSDKLAKLILLGPATPKYTKTEDWPHGNSPEDAEHFLQQELNNWFEFRKMLVEAQFYKKMPEQLTQWFLYLCMKTPPWAGYESLKRLIESDFRLLLPKITVPTYIINGEHDNFIPETWVKYLEEHIPNAKLTVLSDVGHAPQWEDTRQFNEILHGILAE